MLLDDAEPVVNLLNGMHLHEKEQHPPFVLHGNDSRADMATCNEGSTRSPTAK